MPTPPISHLAPLAARYSALLCDAWGVIHNGVDIFPGAADAMRQFRRTRGPVIILTNAPRPSAIIPPQLDRLGLPRDAYDAVVTSGDATRAAIAERLPAPAYRLGPAKDEALYEGVDIKFVALEDAKFIVCTGLVDDQRETPDAYRPILEKAAGRQLPMICANPDKIVRWGGRLVYCAGALAEIYESLGGEVAYGGKPYAPIYDLALREISNVRGSPIDRKAVLAVGDGVGTDIAGANAQGIDALFVTGEGGVHIGPADEAAIEKALAAAGAHAVAVMESLQW